MATFRSYSKSEEAYADAAFLCGMGLDATVFDERAFGGNLLGNGVSGIRIELPDEQITEANQLMAARVSEEKAPLASSPEPVAPVNLDCLFRWLLISDLGLSALIVGGGDFLTVTPPDSVNEFLVSLSFSDALWRLAYLSYWPLTLFGMLSNILCLFYNRIGRSLFAFTIVWSLLIQLGPPPQILGPAIDFIGGLQGTLTCIALALMYWSPLSERFKA
jgi:hypothetical protein